ncbi:hypothetical protein [Azospirillum sp. INR13]|nr:hypothetical protein [Azospirillum sp. INR13]
MFDPSPLIVPLRDADGAIAARCVAMPYLAAIRSAGYRERRTSIR